jgi:hypothetical protein
MLTADKTIAADTFNFDLYNILAGDFGYATPPILSSTGQSKTILLDFGANGLPAANLYAYFNIYPGIYSLALTLIDKDGKVATTSLPANRDYTDTGTLTNAGATGGTMGALTPWTNPNLTIGVNGTVVAPPTGGNYTVELLDLSDYVATKTVITKVLDLPTTTSNLTTKLLPGLLNGSILFDSTTINFDAQAGIQNLVISSNDAVLVGMLSTILGKNLGSALNIDLADTTGANASLLNAFTTVLGWPTATDVQYSQHVDLDCDLFFKALAPMLAAKLNIAGSLTPPYGKENLAKYTFNVTVTDLTGKTLTKQIDLSLDIDLTI